MSQVLDLCGLSSSSLERYSLWHKTINAKNFSELLDDKNKRKSQNYRQKNPPVVLNKRGVKPEIEWTVLVTLWQTLDREKRGSSRPSEPHSSFPSTALHKTHGSIKYLKIVEAYSTGLKHDLHISSHNRPFLQTDDNCITTSVRKHLKNTHTRSEWNESYGSYK